MDPKERQFMQVTGRSQAEARNFLKMANGDLEQAIGMAFDGTTPTSDAPSQTTPPPPPQWGTAPRSSKQRGGVRTMADVMNDGSEANDDNVQSYLSHDGQSGMLTLDPERRDDPVSRIFSRAKPQAHWGEDDDEDSDDAERREFMRGKGGKGASSDWTSTGGNAIGRPGQEPISTSGGRGVTNPSQIPGAAPQPKPQQNLKKRMKLTMYKNGFTIDDGPLHPNSDPRTQSDLAMIASGRIPPHLAAGYSHDLSVSLEDKRSENAPEPPRDPFAEPGNTIGGMQPPKTTAHVPQQHNPHPTTSAPTLSSLSNSPSQFMIQCRFPGLPAQKFVFTNTSTLSDLYKRCREHLQIQKIELATPFPKVVLNEAADGRKTLVELQLQNSAVMVRPL